MSRKTKFISVQGKAQELKRKRMKLSKSKEVIGRNANIVEAVMPGRNLHAPHINKNAER